MLDIYDKEVAALWDHGIEAHRLQAVNHVVTLVLHGLWELHKVAAGLAKVSLLPLKAYGYCGLGRADEQGERSTVPRLWGQLGLIAAALLSHHLPTCVASCTPHLGLSGTVEDRILVHRPQMLHDVIWAQDPAHLDQKHRSGWGPQVWTKAFFSFCLHHPPRPLHSPSSRWH
jgi:hypothetical protein